MSAAYIQARALHDLGATPRASEAATPPVEGLRATTYANATRYAKEAAARALASLMAGDTEAARAHLHKSQGWDAYALTLAQ